MALIDYTNVEIRQQEQVVLHDVNLNIGTGEYVYLLGKVGCGKSTLMKTFYAEIPIAAGNATMLDYDLTRIRRKDIPYLRRKIGIVFQDFQLLTDRSVEENLRFVLKATGWKDKVVMKTHIHEVLSQVGMENKCYKMPHQLSGGEQQRVVIARALLNSPEIILADEPTGNLDPETGEEIMQLLYSIRTSGTTIIMSTHNRSWVDKYPGRRLYFKDGHITEQE
ncbi:MAG: ATP-binding cassette domain-containing protein [Paludibacter sp.]|nr:ATP-binding cassette domain-containing protein [Bacteroidales bacterium]MCM1068852.1 ATP-binding cassette domain-containing protein [Prevotella sp.]MCM1353113.1 ATP-binding cassette domain-containing protein [Bacteroides sp.]MCM1442435.1 ATP-binding cassette domain-containing protein [Muribaculum sp.]MCM1481278.1 ATP-binding cassette domain-containing protein [Paludibacter sp.]